MLSLSWLLSCATEDSPKIARAPIYRNEVLDGIVLSEMYIPAYKYEPTVYSFEFLDTSQRRYVIHVQPSGFVTVDTMAEMIEPNCRVILGPLNISDAVQSYEIEAHKMAVFELPQEPLSSKTLNTPTDSVVANGTQ